MAHKTETILVPSDARGQRLDAWLGSLARFGTRSQIQRAISTGRVRVGNAEARASLKLKGGERIEVGAADTVVSDDAPEPEDIALDVLYEDEAIIAVNKAPGVVVHPGAGNRSGTLVNALLHRYPRSRWPGEGGRPGIVHRLDRDTSGVMLIARTVEVHEALSRQFRRREVEKEYLALVRAKVTRGGKIEAPIGRHRSDRKKMSTSANRSRQASTTYEPREGFGPATLLSVRPLTGRTHQIRVHLAAKGWPIVGDKVYGASGSKPSRGIRKEIAEILGSMPRQALHAAAITFTHPLSGERMSIDAPLAPDFAILLSKLRAVS